MISDFERNLRKQLIARKLLVPAEAAFLLGKSKSTINRWIKAGLPSYVDPRDGQQYVKLAEVHAWNLDPTHRTRKRSKR